MLKKLIAVAVAVLIFASVFACGEKPADTAETAAQTTAETTAGEEISPLDALPPNDFGGYEFRILGDVNSNWWIISLDAEDLDGEIINDTVYERNRFVESKYNVVISSQETTNAMPQVEKSVNAGSADYDMVWERINAMVKTAQNGYFRQLNAIDSISFDPRFWDPNSAEAFNINGRLFFVCCDINVHCIEGCSAMYFSKTLIDNLGLENPYELVRAEKWTLAKMGEMMRAAAADTNGDGVRNEGDTFGLVTGIGQYLSLVSGTGEQLVHKETGSDGKDSFRLNLDSEKMIEVTGIVCDLLNDKNLSVIVNDDNWGYNSFFSDHSLFYIMQLGSIIMMRENMETDFGVLPFPMYDENQGYYTNGMEATAQAMCIPASVREAELVGAVSEAMAVYSDAYLTDAYYDTTLKGKIARDEDTVEMLDILTANRVFDYSTCYSNWDIYTKYRTSIQRKGASELVSLQAKLIDSFNKNAEATIEAYSNIGG
ncbi:MAG: hypothetical protein GX897_05330 [Clostridiales bacterium]|nr:hypothetical protein [Clostridiales bacterium]